MQLLDLPNELLIIISSFLEDEYCLNAFLQTCKHFFLLLNRSLYQFNVRNSGGCALEWAAKGGHEATARYALEAGASPNAARYEKWLPMALASIHGHAPVRWCEDEGPPLMLAAGRGHEDVVRLLLSYGVHPDIRCQSSERYEISPLSVAVRHGSLPIVKLLVSLGSDVQIQGRWGPNVVVDAARGGHYDVVRLLSETNPATDPYIESEALFAAAGEGHADIVNFFLNRGMALRPDTSLSIALLILATERGHYLVADRIARSMDLESFIANGDLDYDHQRHLMLVSATRGWQHLIDMLLERGCPPDFEHPLGDLWTIIELTPSSTSYAHRNPSPLALAAYRGNHSAVKLLLNHKSDIYTKEWLLNQKEPTPLLMAIDGGHKSIVNTLLDHGADPDHRTCGKVPVLFKAVKQPEILQLLLDRGANCAIRAHGNESILIRALRTGSLAAADILQRKCSFNELPLAQDPVPLFLDPAPTSLLEAAALGGAPMLRRLLESDYQVSPGAREVEPALRTIVSRADTVSLKLLLDRGLVDDLITANSNELLGSLHTPSGDSNAIADTLDMLIANGMPMEAFDWRLRNAVLAKWTVLVQLLVDRGANPLLIGWWGTSPLGEAASHGYKELVRIMLQSLDQQDIPIDVLQTHLDRDSRIAKDDIRPLLSRFYWRKKYQATPTPYRG